MKHSEALKTHMKTHEPGYVAQTYSCDDCSITYKNQFSLRRHMRVFHEGIKPYFCEVCKQAFSNTNVSFKLIIKNKEYLNHTRFYLMNNSDLCICGESLKTEMNLLPLSLSNLS